MACQVKVTSECFVKTKGMVGVELQRFCSSC